MDAVSSRPFEGFASPSAAVATKWLEARGALVVAKARPGFDSEATAAIGSILRAVAAGGCDALRFLVFDFAKGEGEPGRAPEGFADMVAANAELVVDAQVISLAWARGTLTGLDFDFALSCSAVVAEEGARFSLSGEPFDLLGLYAALGRRIGFARTERLIESERPLLPQEALDLMILRDVAPAREGLDAIDAYLSTFERRYNAAHAVFRARRIAEPPIDRRPVTAFGRGR